MLSAGMLTDLASAMIVRSRGLLSASPPPLRAATVSSLMTRVKSLPRLASAAPFLCLIVCHLEWPDMAETPEKSKENDPGSYHFSSPGREDDPGVRPIVAEHRVHTETGPLQPRRYLPDRQRPECQGETVAAALPVPDGHIVLVENRQPFRSILADRLHQRDRGMAAHPAGQRLLARILFPPHQVRNQVDAETGSFRHDAGDRGERRRQVGFPRQRLQ